MRAATKKKPKTISKLKADLWKIYSQVMKRRRSPDGLYVYCYTCDKPLEIGTSNCQLGHWLPKGGYSAHYFTENNTRPQCYHCNINLSGNSAVFERRLREEIGAEAVEQIYESRHETKKLSREWYQAQIDRYTVELKTF